MRELDCVSLISSIENDLFLALSRLSQSSRHFFMLEPENVSSLISNSRATGPVPWTAAKQSAEGAITRARCHGNLHYIPLHDPFHRFNALVTLFLVGVRESVCEDLSTMLHQCTSMLVYFCLYFAVLLRHRSKMLDF